MSHVFSLWWHNLLWQFKYQILFNYSMLFVSLSFKGHCSCFNEGNKRRGKCLGKWRKSISRVHCYQQQLVTFYSTNVTVFPLVLQLSCWNLHEALFFSLLNIKREMRYGELDSAGLIAVSLFVQEVLDFVLQTLLVEQSFIEVGGLQVNSNHLGG